MIFCDLKLKYNCPFIFVTFYYEINCILLKVFNNDSSTLYKASNKYYTRSVERILIAAELTRQGLHRDKIN